MFKNSSKMQVPEKHYEKHIEHDISLLLMATLEAKQIMPICH